MSSVRATPAEDKPAAKVPVPPGTLARCVAPSIGSGINPPTKGVTVASKPCTLVVQPSKKKPTQVCLTLCLTLCWQHVATRPSNARCFPQQWPLQRVARHSIRSKADSPASRELFAEPKMKCCLKLRIRDIAILYSPNCPNSIREVTVLVRCDLALVPAASDVYR